MSTTATPSTPAPIPIGNLDKMLLLEALWYRIPPRTLANGMLFPEEGFNRIEAFVELASNPDYLRATDHVQGQYIICDISGDTVDPSRFDSKYGAGAFQSAVDVTKKMMEKREATVEVDISLEIRRCMAGGGSGGREREGQGQAIPKTSMKKEEEQKVPGGGEGSKPVAEDASRRAEPQASGGNSGKQVRF
ncbi:hypothetical protein BJY04DRAFT_213736 [Aspergillus karnatakaensis]|uniref:uncharacterized protein n=1 Tax=Aspergillus karnatakaensis TaxID=1810916 RepID=UPI003CCD908B